MSKEQAEDRERRRRQLEEWRRFMEYLDGDFPMIPTMREGFIEDLRREIRDGNRPQPRDH